MNRRLDEGFTLIELLVSIAILGVIGGSLAGAIIVTFTDTASKLRVSEAHDKQIAGVYWAQDVASSDAFTTTSPQCSVPTGTLLVGMQWTDDRGLNKVDYVVDGPDGFAFDSTVLKTLYRYSCIGSGTTSKVPVADQVLTAACSPTCVTLSASSTAAQLVLTERNSTITVDGTRRVS